MNNLIPWISLTVLALGGVLVGDWRDIRFLRIACKPLASLGFLGAAVAAGALHQPYGQAVMVALVFCWGGDVALIGKSQAALLAGIGLFLIGHLGFVAAFLVHGFDDRVAFRAGLMLAPVLAAVLWWLWPRVSERMRRPVIAYIAVITTMVATAAGAVAMGLPTRVGWGAGLFFVSDLFVARNRFVESGLINRVIGLPLYYAGVLLLATSMAP